MLNEKSLEKEEERSTENWPLLSQNLQEQEASHKLLALCHPKKKKKKSILKDFN